MPVLGARVTGDCDHRKAGGAGGGRGEPREAVAGEGLRATQAEDVRAVGGSSTKEGQDLTIALMLGGEGPEGTNGRSWEATAQKGRAGLRQAARHTHAPSSGSAPSLHFHRSSHLGQVLTAPILILQGSKLRLLQKPHC